VGRADNLTTLIMPTVFIPGSLKLLEPSGPVQASNGIALPLSRKVAGSIPDGVGIFQGLLAHYGPGVDSASNRNEYQEYFLGVKVAGA
jgi:hypothetical protein